MSNDLQEIKERIYDEELIETVLEELECENIKPEAGGDRFTARLPFRFDSDSNRSVQVYNNEYLNAYVRSRKISGDIYALIGYILYGANDFEEVKENLFQIKAWLCNLFDWDEYLSNKSDFDETKQRKDYNAWLRPIQKRRKKKRKKREHKENKVLDLHRTVSRYDHYAHWEFYKDGIQVKTQNEFGVMFCRESERVVYPFHNKDGKLIGIKGRYVGSSKITMKEMKYLFLYPCDKSIELYNLHKALPYIEDQSEVIVVESAKSVMLAWQWGYRNVVSIEGSDLSPVQESLLRQLKADITFAFDKDFEVEDIEKVARRLKRIRACRAVYDEEDILDKNDSPLDKGKEIWDTMYSKNKYLIK